MEENNDIISINCSKRLIINKIILHNFKSYSGTQVIGPFDINFTTIIGANGSGKSNLVESLIFLFGKKASWLRLKAFKELIHYSNYNKDATEAYVEVEFYEIEEVLNNAKTEYNRIENSEFTIRRTVNKKSNTQYYLNNQKVNKEVIINLLKSKNLDLVNNRFMILQGEVEQISTMVPKSGNPDSPGLLEYLEDIIGTDVYVPELSELEKDIELLESKKNTTFDEIQILKEDIGSIKEQKDKAIEYYNTEKEYYFYQKISLQINLTNYNYELSKKDNFKEEITQKISTVKENMKNVLKNNDNFTNELKKMKNKAEDIEKKITIISAKLKTLNAKDNTLRNELLSNSNNLVDLKEQLSKEIKKIENLKKPDDIKSKEILKTESEIENYNSKLAIINNEIEVNMQKIEKNSSNILTKKNDINNNIFTLKSKYDSLKNEIIYFNSEYDNYMAEKDKYIEVINEYNKIKKEKEEKIKYYEGNIQQSKDTMVTIKQKLFEIDKNKNEFMSKSTEITNKIRMYSSILEEQNHFQKQVNSNNKVLSYLNGLQRNKQISGLIGVVGQMVSTTENLEKAVIAACGSLGFIAFRKYSMVQKAVEFLKKDKIGFANFIAIDKIEHLREEMNNSYENNNELGQRLFDLLKYSNEDAKLLVYFGLRDTMLSSNIEKATKLAYGKVRRRVVTINGELIERNGTIVSGVKYKKGMILIHELINKRRKQVK